MKLMGFKIGNITRGGDVTVKCEDRYSYHCVNDTWKNIDHGVI